MESFEEVVENHIAATRGRCSNSESLCVFVCACACACAVPLCVCRQGVEGKSPPLSPAVSSTRGLRPEEQQTQNLYHRFSPGFSSGLL